MNDNAEGGIAGTQAKLAQNDGLQNHHKETIGYLNERVVVYLFMLAFIGLLMVWMAASSPYVLYGATGMVALFAILFGVLRVKRIHQIREQRARQAEEMQQKS
jgi:hypothetical protein